MKLSTLPIPSAQQIPRSRSREQPRAQCIRKPPATGSEEAPQDLSSTHVRMSAKMWPWRDACANVHLPTGRTCTLPVRHPGSCNFVGPEDANDVAVH